MNDDSRLDDYLRQMIEGSRDAASFTDGMDRKAFLADLRTQRAVVMSLMIVGEAAARVLATIQISPKPIRTSHGAASAGCAIASPTVTST